MVYDDGSMDKERSVSIMAMKTIWWTRCCHCGVHRSKGEFCVTNEHYPEDDRYCYNQTNEPPVERVGKMVEVKE
jgi:hypothetical protein